MLILRAEEQLVLSHTSELIQQESLILQRQRTAAYIREKYGSEYVGGTVAYKEQMSNAQDAHEAIRPTDVTLTPELIKDSLTRDQFRLYQLIWKRFVASQYGSGKV